MSQNLKRYAPAVLRNRDPILAVLREVLPHRGQVLEIAAGSGEHAVFFAAAFPGLDWQPSDADPECLASIAAWAAGTGLANLRPPLRLDARMPPWPGISPESVDAVLCINMIHIAPWEACHGLMCGAAAGLRPAGMLFLYGPYRQGRRHTAPSNAAFDRQLRAQNPEFGVRDLEDVVAEAEMQGLNLERQVVMPANNFSLVFRKRSGMG
jgi:hypothetical protein